MRKNKFKDKSILHSQTLHKKCERILRSKCRWEGMSRMAVLREWSSLLDDCVKCSENIRKPENKNWKNPCEDEKPLTNLIIVANRLAAGWSIEDAFNK
jgi:hypothetical protein